MRRKKKRERKARLKFFVTWGKRMGDGVWQPAACSVAQRSAVQKCCCSLLLARARVPGFGGMA